MTRPKKWFMEENDVPGGGIVLKNSDGLLKKPNTHQPLGRISGVIWNLVSWYVVFTIIPLLYPCIQFRHQ